MPNPKYPSRAGERRTPVRISKARATRRGFSLVELVTALAISSILVAAMGSAVVVASAALPSEISQSTTEAGIQLDRIMLDVCEAEQIKSATNTALTFVVPDRDGNGQTELISYTWSGTKNTPLYRSFNGGTAEVVVDSVASFAVTTTTASSNLGLSVAVSRSRYTSISVSMKPTGAPRVLNRSVELPNEPRILELWVRADFDSNVGLASFDRDHSGASDWTTSASHNPTTVANGLWNADADLNVRSPGAINTPMTISMRLAIEDEDDYARIYTAVESSGLSVAAIRMTITADDTDLDIRVEQFTGVLWTTMFTESTALGPIDISLVIEPKSNRAILVANGIQVDSGIYARSAFGSSGTVQFSRSGSNVLVDWIDVRIGGSS